MLEDNSSKKERVGTILLFFAEDIRVITEKVSKKEFDGLVKSPLNYTGNKFRILNQIIPFAPRKVNLMVDLFCGGATVGLNIPAKKVVFVDSNPRVINLLKHLSTYKSFEDLLSDILEIIYKYELSLSSVNGYKYYKDQIKEINPNNGLKKYNEVGFYKLRETYNKLEDKNEKNANIMLYVLMVYAFNNDMRFSNSGDFNLPAGKTDFNLSNARKLYHYLERVRQMNYEFICGDFSDPQIVELIEAADFVYMDPPYLITRAVYNESNKWTNDDEHRLLSSIDYMVTNEKSFMLSNVLEKKNIKNEPLNYWVELNKDHIDVIPIEYHYRSSSYNKKNRDAAEKEVIIIPRKERNVKNK